MSLGISINESNFKFFATLLTLNRLSYGEVPGHEVLGFDCEAGELKWSNDQADSYTKIIRT